MGLDLTSSKQMPSYDVIKRVIDIVVSLLAIIVFSPILIFTSLLVLAFLGRPILFAQIRPGKDGKPFKLRKFRSMCNSIDVNGVSLPDEQRISRFGLLLRRSSLDELPSLFNVLKGDMSLVGPRPLLMEYLPLYSDQQNKRHLVRPGITGLAQVNGRNNLTWNDKFSWDIKYVESRSFLFDVSIILKTIRTVCGGKGVNAGGVVGMEKFTGSAGVKAGSSDKSTHLSKSSSEV